MASQPLPLLEGDELARRRDELATQVLRPCLSFSISYLVVGSISNILVPSLLHIPSGNRVQS
jgi:hypothetical protein